MQPHPLPDPHKNPYSDLLWLSLLLGSLFFMFLGVRPLFVPDEGRYAEIAREMVASMDYVTPHLNGIKYFEKPALFYWLGAAAIHVGGLNLWSIRSINVLLGLLGCLATYLTTRKLYDRETGLLAALLLGTSALYFVMTHMISLDLPVTVFIMLSLYGFLMAIQQPAGLARRFYIWGAAVFAALAVLTKGLIGIVFPVMIASLWIAIMGEWRLLARLYLPSAVTIFLLIAVPWHVLVQQRHPEFFHFYFIEQQFLRYTTEGIGHDQPAWFFIPWLLAGFFPWSFFLPSAILALARQGRKNPVGLFLLIWVISIFLFFSCSKSKLIPYILPIFPPLAILTAHHIRQTFHFPRQFKFSYQCLLIFAVLMAAACLWIPRHIAMQDQSAARLDLALAAACLISGTFWAYRCLLRNPRKAFAIQLLSTSFFLLGIYAAFPALDTRTIQPLARILQTVIKPQDEVITYNQYYQDLPFYLQQRVSILNWQNELTYGMKHQDTTQWMINDSVFARRWQGGHRVFAVMSKQEYPTFAGRYPRHVVLGETVGNLLVSNQS